MMCSSAVSPALLKTNIILDVFYKFNCSCLLTNIRQFQRPTWRMYWDRIKWVPKVNNHVVKSVGYNLQLISRFSYAETKHHTWRFLQVYFTVVSWYHSKAPLSNFDEALRRHRIVSKVNHFVLPYPIDVSYDLRPGVEIGNAAYSGVSEVLFFKKFHKWKKCNTGWLLRGTMHY